MHKAVYGKLLLLAVTSPLAGGALVWGLMGPASFVSAQEKAPPESSSSSDEPSPSTSSGQSTRKPRGRLPAYFSSVVTQEQRETIYEIQHRYAQQLEALQAQIEKLVTERDRQVDEVLTPEQLTIVNQKRAEALKRREMRRAAQSSSP